MAEQYVNFGTTTLNTSINNVTTTVIVDDGSVFPSVGDFRVVIEAEIMRCTARSSNTLTVVRGEEGTAAAAHTSGLAVKSTLTVDSLHKKISDNVLSGPATGLPSPSNPGRLYLSTDEPAMLRDSGSAWELFVNGVKMWNPNDQTWSWGYNESAVSSLITREFSQGMRRSGLGGTPGYESRMKAAPTPPYVITAVMEPIYSNCGFQLFGIGFHNSVDNEIVIIRADALANDPHMNVITAANWGLSSVSLVADVGLPRNSPARAWLRIEDDNTDLKFYWSLDQGLNWHLLWTQGRTATMAAPTHVIWFTSLFTSGGIIGSNLLSWLEE